MSKSARFFLVLALLSAGVAVAHDDPPSDLHLVGNHWTAWNPPSVPPDVPVHIIERGDTLWDLAARFYGDPYLWPQLWEQNQYILDAHWIYPGDPLVVSGVGLPVPGDQLGDLAAPPLDSAAAITITELGEGDDGAATDDGGRSILSGTDGPVPLGHESDIYCSGYIGEEGEAFAYRITGTELDFTTPSLNGFRDREIIGTFGSVNSEKVGLSVSDIAYLDAGRADGLSAGDLLVAVKPGKIVVHPRTDEKVGQFYQYAGRVRILAAQEETSIAEVVMACDMVSVGVGLKPFEPEPVPLRRMTPVRPLNYPAPAAELEQGASIVFSKDTAITLGSGHLVFIDRGDEDDVVPGDIFTVYRRTREGLPPMVLGEVAILSTQRHTALARILQSRYTVYIGDTLLPK